MFAFFNLGAQELLVLLALVLVGAAVVGIVLFLTIGRFRDRDD